MEVVVKGIGYIRVSRVGHGESDSVLSPQLQGESIERVCQREGVELVDVYEEPHTERSPDPPGRHSRRARQQTAVGGRVAESQLRPEP
jgi:hypothetical protein